MSTLPNHAHPIPTAAIRHKMNTSARPVGEGGVSEKFERRRQEFALLGERVRRPRSHGATWWAVLALDLHQRTADWMR